MRITTEGTLTAIQLDDRTTIILGLDGAFREADFGPLVEKIGLKGVEMSSRGWDYAEQDGFIVWSLVTR